MMQRAFRYGPLAEEDLPGVPMRIGAFVTCDPQRARTLRVTNEFPHSPTKARSVPRASVRYVGT
jgi:hypothetical protein